MSGEDLQYFLREGDVLQWMSTYEVSLALSLALPVPISYFSIVGFALELSWLKSDHC
jgi:hypothetical protein